MYPGVSRAYLYQIPTDPLGVSAHERVEWPKGDTAQHCEVAAPRSECSHGFSDLGGRGWVANDHSLKTGFSFLKLI